MIVTITTDASYCERTRAAGWAAWAESERGRFFGGNALPGSFSCVNSVEVAAALRGLEIAVERGIVAAGDHFTLQTDSQHAAGRLHPSYQTRRNRLRSRRGLEPLPRQQPPDATSPRARFFRIVHDLRLTFEIVCSRRGDYMRHVDRFARACMMEERAARQNVSIEAAHLAAFEAGLQEARMEYVKSQLAKEGT
jgi:ribonuclease HI